MPTVVVEAQRIAPTTGTVILDQQLIEDLPIRNGSVNELIGIVPGVQYSEGYNTSLSGGEIFPPPVSISGSRFYDNNYTIDGLDNTSILNPAENNIADVNKLPGHPQKQILNPRIIEQISVYHSNIPAEYGGFSGGQINVKLIEPTPDFWGQISYRTTRDSWTQFHIDPEEKEDFTAAEKSSYQPQFTKQDFGLTLNIPITPDTAFLTTYQKVLSKVTLNHIDESKTLYRERENILLKVAHELPSNGRVSISGLYSPTHSTYSLDGVSHSDYDIDQSTYLLNLNIEKETNAGTIYAQTGFISQKLVRHSDAKNKYRWDSGNLEGGMGDLEYAESELSAALAFEFTPLDTGEINHQIKTGLNVARSKLTYKRHEHSIYYYSFNEDTATSCLDGDTACINGSGYLENRIVYQKANESSSSSHFEFYLQDSIAWKRLELFPGVRLSRDTLTSDTNIAPRFSSSWDIFGNSSTILFVGRNRYYSNTLLEQGHYSYFSQNRSSSISEWDTTATTYFTDEDIEAPYADETTAGIIQKLFGGELKAQHIHKKHHKEFARTRIYDGETGIRTYILNNNGRSEHDSIQISWQRNWVNQYIEANATWQVSNSSNNLYREIINDEDTSETFWYEGKEYYYYEMPKTDFNRPVIVNFIYRYKLPYNIHFTNTTKYRGKYWKLMNTGVKLDGTGGPSYVYEKVKAKSAITFDWSLSWKIPNFSKSYVTVVNLDILNVFNKKNRWDYQSGKYGYDYEIGRQFWLGLDINF